MPLSLAMNMSGVGRQYFLEAGVSDLYDISSKSLGPVQADGVDPRHSIGKIAQVIILKPPQPVLATHVEETESDLDKTMESQSKTKHRNRRTRKRSEKSAMEDKATQTDFPRLDTSESQTMHWQSSPLGSSFSYRMSSTSSTQPSTSTTTSESDYHVYFPVTRLTQKELETIAQAGVKAASSLRPPDPVLLPTDQLLDDIVRSISASSLPATNSRYKTFQLDTMEGAKVDRVEQTTHYQIKTDVHSDFGISRSISNGTTYVEAASATSLFNSLHPMQDAVRSTVVNNSYSQKIFQTIDANSNYYINANFSTQFNGSASSDGQSLDGALQDATCATRYVPNVQTWTIPPPQPYAARDAIFYENRDVLDLATNINDPRWTYTPSVLPTVSGELYTMAECPYCDFRYPIP